MTICDPVGCTCRPVINSISAPRPLLVRVFEQACLPCPSAEHPTTSTSVQCSGSTVITNLSTQLHSHPSTADVFPPQTAAQTQSQDFSQETIHPLARIVRPSPREPFPLQSRLPHNSCATVPVPRIQIPMGRYRPPSPPGVLLPHTQ